MRNSQYRISHGADGVERASEIAKSLFNTARGNYETDQQTVAAIARQAQLTPAAVRRFLQPSRRPKDVSLTVWARLVSAYRRYLEQRLAALQTEIARVDALDTDDRALGDLLDEAKALVSRIEAAARDG